MAISKFLRDNITIMIGFGLGGIINYVFQVYAGRKLGPENYGTFGTLFAIVMVAWIASSAIERVISRFTSIHTGNNEAGKVKSLIVKSVGKGIRWGLLLLLCYIPVQGYIAGFLGIDDPLLMTLLGIIGFFTIFLPISTGALNGLQRFGWQSGQIMINSGARLIFGVILIYAGFSVFGAMVAVLLGIVISTLVGFIPLLPILREKRQKIIRREVYQYTLPVFLGTLLPMLLITVDIVMVKNAFSAIEAGYYNAAMVFGRALWLSASFLGTVMFPKISNDQTGSVNILKKTLLLSSAVIAAILFVYCLIPGLLADLMFGEGYEIADLVIRAGIAYALFSLSHIVIMYNMATSRFSFNYLLVAAIAIEIVGIRFLAASITDVIVLVAAVNLALLAALLIFTFGGFLGKHGKVAAREIKPLHA
ncbi:MAG: oligosaccharide flippase family protein [archaeon]